MQERDLVIYEREMDRFDVIQSMIEEQVRDYVDNNIDEIKSSLKELLGSNYYSLVDVAEGFIEGEEQYVEALWIACDDFSSELCDKSELMNEVAEYIDKKYRSVKMNEELIDEIETVIDDSRSILDEIETKKEQYTKLFFYVKKKGIVEIAKIWLYSQLADFYNQVFR